MKAAHMKSNVEEIKGLSEAAEIFARVAPATLVEIERSASSAWLPLDLDVELSTAVLDLIGDERAGLWARDSIMNGFDKPYLRPFIGGMRALFGSRIRHALKIVVPHGFMSVYRDAGELSRGTEGTGELELVWSGLPDMILDQRYLVSCAAAIAAVYEVCGVSGKFEVELRAERREASLVFYWDE